MDYKLRLASYDDIDILYRWANDELTRKFSFRTQRILYSEHVNWFHQKMLSSESEIFIYECNQEPTGMLRLEYNNRKAYISFSVDEECRGHGHGGKILELARKYVIEHKVDIKCLYGLVKYSNTASQKKFEEHHYTREDLPDYIQYNKIINSYID